MAEITGKEPAPWWCKRGWHRWTIWSTLYKSESEVFKYQDRVCLSCQLYDRRIA